MKSESNLVQSLFQLFLSCMHVTGASKLVQTITQNRFFNLMRESQIINDKNNVQYLSLSVLENLLFPDHSNSSDPLTDSNNTVYFWVSSSEGHSSGGGTYLCLMQLRSLSLTPLADTFSKINSCSLMNNMDTYLPF